MKKITAYKTTDGIVFEDENTAQEHQVELDWFEWYSINYLPPEPDERDVFEWLIENRKEVMKLLTGEK